MSLFTTTKKVQFGAQKVSTECFTLTFGRATK